MNNWYKTWVVGILILMVAWPLHADDQVEQRLRDNLKLAVTQLRAVQDQLAQAQAAQAEDDLELAKCKDQINDLNVQLKDTKDKWQKDHDAFVQLVAQLREQNALLQRLVEDRERKNYELYKTGNEVLTRYEKFGLGEAILAKEPFVGLTRVKLENLVQGYEDKFAANRTYPGQPPSEVKGDDGAKDNSGKPPLPEKNASGGTTPAQASGSGSIPTDQKASNNDKGASSAATGGPASTPPAATGGAAPVQQAAATTPSASPAQAAPGPAAQTANTASPGNSNSSTPAAKPNDSGDKDKVMKSAQ